MRESIGLFARPSKTGELRMMDLDESITSIEVAAAVVETEGCTTAEEQVGEIHCSTLRLGSFLLNGPAPARTKYVP